jgi:hypothetical protein
MKSFNRYAALAAALILAFASGAALAISTGTNLGLIGFYLANIQTKTGPYTVNATATAGSSDCSTEIVVTSSSTVAVMLPANGVVGCQLAIVQGGTGKVTWTAASGATAINPHSFTGTYSQWSVITAQVIANSGGSAAQWIIGGDGG